MARITYSRIVTAIAAQSCNAVGAGLAHAARAGLVLALIASAPLGAAQDVPDPPPAASPQPSATAVPVKPPICFELDEEQEAKLEKLRGKGAFFDEELFDCEDDWLDTEERYGGVLRSIGQGSFGALTTEPKGRKRAFHLRRVTRGYSHVEVERIDCQYLTDEDGFSLTATGGQATSYYKSDRSNNRHHKRLRLGKADCQFLLDYLEPHALYAIPIDAPMTELVIHGGVSLVEIVDTDGDWSLFERWSGSGSSGPKETAAIEAINTMLNYFSDRAAESGRDIAPQP